MKLRVNQREIDIARDRITIAEFIDEKRLPDTAVVIAVNDVIIPPPEWAGHHLKEGDEMDIVRAVSGGEGLTHAADELAIGGVRFRSRLFLGTGKYERPETMVSALEASGTELVTVAIRYMDPEGGSNGQDPNGSILDQLDLNQYRLLPNTAGAYTAADAVKMARLARAVTGTHWIKLEVIGDKATLWPDVAATVEATRTLVADGFVVLPYTSPDLVAAIRLEEAGAATVMPLASPIGSGQGGQDWVSIKRIIDAASIPVVVDAGIGVPSDAALAMELGAAAVLVNTGIAKAKDPVQMAWAMRQGVEAGRCAYLAGRMPKSELAHASSPIGGVPRVTAAERIE